MDLSNDVDAFNVRLASREIETIWWTDDYLRYATHSNTTKDGNKDESCTWFH